jgi:hypothetical protein
MKEWHEDQTLDPMPTGAVEGPFLEIDWTGTQAVVWAVVLLDEQAMAIAERILNDW